MSRALGTLSFLATSSQIVCSALQIGQPMVVLGTSVGGAVAIDFALHHPEAVAKLCLVDAQGFIDGLGPMAKAPGFLTKFLVGKARLSYTKVCLSRAVECFAGKIWGFACRSAPPGLVMHAVPLQVLKAEWLRQSAASAAYFDKKRFATKDYMRIGRLHTFCPGLLMPCCVCTLALQPATQGAVVHTAAESSSGVVCRLDRGQPSFHQKWGLCTQ